jgi:hypothetical protein
MSKDEPSPRDALWRMTNAYQASQAIHVAATLSIADLLKDGPKSADELAEATSTHAPPSTGSYAHWLAWACSLRSPAVASG